MHILATSTASLDDLVEPVDLRQEPADIVALSFTDSDLSALSAAWNAERDALPSLRLAALRDLRHPMSIDLWVERVAATAKVVLVRILGGYEWWRYGADQLSAAARRHGMKLAMLPGECREQDERLADLSTVSRADLDELLAYFREGGPANMVELVKSLARHAGRDVQTKPATALPKAGYYDHAASAALPETAPKVAILFYRSMLLASDVAPIDALCDELADHGLLPIPIYVASLKDAESIAFVTDAVAEQAPATIISTTAFAAASDAETGSLFDALDVPVFQAIVATTRREAWADGPRGLTPADTAMHVVLPELDGRILAGTLSFKSTGDRDAHLGISAQRNAPEIDRIQAVVDRVARFIRLQRTIAADRRLAILIPHYPSAPGRSGYAVGLDVPQSVIEILSDLRDAGYRVEDIPATAKDLMAALEGGMTGQSAEAYRTFFETIPDAAGRRVLDAWGEPDRLPPTFRAAQFGSVTVALAPDRGRSEDRRADYHDPTIPPRHELVAFGHWLREGLDCHAIVHVGAHGTLEWLPGKTLALSADCFPEIVTGGLPVIYPFIVSNPGEAAQAKRRIGAVTLGHLPPALASAGTDAQHLALERLVDEYAQADGLDRRRRDRLASLIVEEAKRSGLAAEAGVDTSDDPDAALMRIDAWLCDLKDFAIKDGLHIYGRNALETEDHARRASAESERAALLAALDGRRIAAGPSGSPTRGRTDVLPTGRNLFTADPRTMPTPTAFDLGRRAADEIVRRYLQDHGEWPRSLVIDLWGSASLRTGGEEIAQGLALMGCRPQWDASTGRVTGIEVLPPAVLGRPRIDVTWRISGLFRDMFASQIALLDVAVAAVAARSETDDENPLAAAKRTTGKSLARIFGSSPGTYGSGVESLLASGNWDDRAELGQAYLDATSHAFGGTDGDGSASSGAFAQQIADADLLVHTGDDAARDILEGSADVAFIGGFASAIKALGGKADLIALDTTDPLKPRARSVTEAVTRTVRARAINARFIAGQMRHGPRGASEFAETVDRLVGFAETTDAIPGNLIEALYDAYVADDRVREFIIDQNPDAAAFISQRFKSARRRGLWHPLRNSVDELLDLMGDLDPTSAGRAA